jgi:glycosyltransferase involved in cell wall biosynthesis
MRIAIEAQRIFRKNKHGMDFVALETIRELQKIDHSNEYFIFVAKGDDICLEESSNFHIITLNMPSYPLWEQIALPIAAKKVNADILHCTSNTAPIFCKVPIIVTLHDIIFLEKKRGNNKSLYQNVGWLYRKIVVPRVLKKCKHIITVSNYECNHIKETLGIDGSLISPIYNGYNTHFKHIDNYYSTTSKYFSSKNYLFFLGNTDPKKNTERVLQAYSLYSSKTQNPLPLVVADLKKDLLSDTIEKLGLSSISKQIISPGYIINSDLPSIYSGAKAFIYTSLRESFGIPILESMACGTPVITSNTSAMPEIADESALIVDPYNINDIADAIYDIDNNIELHKTIREKGYKRVTLFDWDRTANQTFSIYEQVYNCKS